MDQVSQVVLTDAVLNQAEAYRRAVHDYVEVRIWDEFLGEEPETSG